MEQHEVALPGLSARYLRLLWQSPQAAPTLSSAQLASSTTSSLPLPLVWSQPLAGSSAKAGEYTWQLPSACRLSRCGSNWRRPTAWRR
ncbi:DUF3999 family protein [Pseudomonas sp. PCH446]